MHKTYPEPYLNLSTKKVWIQALQSYWSYFLLWSLGLEVHPRALASLIRLLPFLFSLLRQVLPARVFLPTFSQADRVINLESFTLLFAKPKRVHATQPISPEMRSKQTWIKLNRIETISVAYLFLFHKFCPLFLLNEQFHHRDCLKWWIQLDLCEWLLSATCVFLSPSRANWRVARWFCAMRSAATLCNVYIHSLIHLSHNSDWGVLGNEAFRSCPWSICLQRAVAF